MCCHYIYSLVHQKESVSFISNVKDEPVLQSALFPFCFHTDMW